MRKYMLLGASLLLLAATACNREKEAVPADGFVKLRFTAVVGDGSTRTAYENDKTASWVAGDAISVYVTDGTEGRVVTFTADESLTFEGQVPAGFTTIVAGAYPADAAHTFDATGVKTLHLPASYTLNEEDDPASILPLAGTYADGVMTFRHPFGALKFTIDNVPATATRFRFTTFGHRINGNYAPDAELEDTVVDAEKSMDISFPAAEGSFAFYVPMPAGELYAESVITLYDEEGRLLFQKVAPKAITVTRNVIKRIAAVETWKKNDQWQGAYLRDVYNRNSGQVVSYVGITGTTGKYDYSLSSKSYFETYYGTAEGFLSSSFIPNRKAEGSRTPKEGDLTVSFNRLSPGPRVLVIYGLDDEYNFTGEYNAVEFEVPEFVTPEGWSLTFNPQLQLSNGEIHPAVNVKVPAGTTWASAYMKKENFVSNYGGDAVALIWAQRNATSAIRESTDINLYFTTLEETEYIFIAYGVKERPDEDSERTFTYEYCLLEFSNTPPTDAYQAWIGQWAVTDSGESPFTDTWTISAKNNNLSYYVQGLGNHSVVTCEARLDKETGQLVFPSQKDFVTVSTTNDSNVKVCLYGTNGSIFYTGTYDLMYAAFDDDAHNAATLSSFDMEKYSRYKLYGYVDGVLTYNFGARFLPSTMERVAASEVMAPDGWSRTAAEAPEAEETEPVLDLTETIDAEE